MFERTEASEFGRRQKIQVGEGSSQSKPLQWGRFSLVTFFGDTKKVTPSAASKET